MPLDQRHLLIFEGSGFPSAALDPMAEIPMFTLSHENVIYYNAMQVLRSVLVLGGWILGLRDEGV